MKKRNFSFDLFGFDWIGLDSVYGFWLFDIQLYHSESRRSLLMIYYAEGELQINIGFVRVI